MRDPVIACADPALAAVFRPEVEAAGARLVVLPPPRRVAPSPGAAWERAASEMALCPWLLLATRWAGEAVLEAAGGPPAATVRVAAVADAARPLAEAGRPPDITAASVGELLERMAPALGRRQRVLAPHAAGAGRRLRAWLEAVGADPLPVAAYDFAAATAETTPWVGSPAVAALAGSPEEVEVLRWAVGDVLLAARDRAAAEAAEDCDFTRVRAVAARLGPFLDEALS